jgi:hypothetical protein
MIHESQVENEIVKFASFPYFESNISIVDNVASSILEMDDSIPFVSLTRKFITICLTGESRLVALMIWYERQIQMISSEKVSGLLCRYIEKHDYEFTDNDFRNIEIVILKILSMADDFVVAEKIATLMAWRLFRSFEMSLVIIYQKVFSRSKIPGVQQTMQRVIKLNQFIAELDSQKSNSPTQEVDILKKIQNEHLLLLSDNRVN